MSGGKHGGGAAAEVDGLERWEIFAGVVAGFDEKGVDEGSEISFTGGVLVEGAVGADAVTKGNVEVEMHSPNNEL